jgi:hypothetical protein
MSIIAPADGFIEEAVIEKAKQLIKTKNNYANNSHLASESMIMVEAYGSANRERALRFQIASNLFGNKLVLQSSQVTRNASSFAKLRDNNVKLMLGKTSKDFKRTIESMQFLKKIPAYVNSLAAKTFISPALCLKKKLLRNKDYRRFVNARPSGLRFLAGLKPIFLSDRQKLPAHLRRFLTWSETRIKSHLGREFQYFFQTKQLVNNTGVEHTDVLSVIGKSAVADQLNAIQVLTAQLEAARFEFLFSNTTVNADSTTFSEFTFADSLNTIRATAASDVFSSIQKEPESTLF